MIVSTANIGSRFGVAQAMASHGERVAMPITAMPRNIAISRLLRNCDIRLVNSAPISTSKPVTTSPPP